MCPSLTLVEPDPETAEREWEAIVRRLEDSGFSVEPAGPGCAYFETRGVERLYGGLEKALKRALEAVGSSWDPRVGAAERRFAALAAATVARPGQMLVVSNEQSPAFLAPHPLTLLPLETGRRQELQDLGVRTIGGLAALPDASVAERLGADGRRAHGLARGGSKRRVRGRRQPAEIVESLDLPRGRRQRAHAAARVRGAPRSGAGPAGAGRTLHPQDRTLGPARRRWVVAADGDAPRSDRGARAAKGSPRSEARRVARARPGAQARARRPDRVAGDAARARPSRRSGNPLAPAGGLEAGARQHRIRLCLQRRRSLALVSDTGIPSTSRSAGRVNEPRSALVEPGFDGTPRTVNRQAVALVREEWHVVERWWTEEPVRRRYFEVVLEGGQNTVVFRDEERGSWFTQRGA